MFLDCEISFLCVYDLFFSQTCTMSCCVLTLCTKKVKPSSHTGSLDANTTCGGIKDNESLLLQGDKTTAALGHISNTTVKPSDGNAGGGSTLLFWTSLSMENSTKELGSGVLLVSWKQNQTIKAVCKFWWESSLLSPLYWFLSLCFCQCQKSTLMSNSLKWYL